jgi:pantoate--beta-alanine ligase
MRIIHDLDEMTETARGWLAGGSVGFVPTMGHIHAGHVALIQSSLQECELSVVSILDMPLHVDSDESHSQAHVPHDLAKDLQLLDKEQVDVVFIPRPEDFFPVDFSTHIIPSGPVAERLEGAATPANMRGFATAMMKLFQLVRPDVVFLGQKKAQEAALIRKLVRDLNIDLSVRVLPIVRESDGLAISRRNDLLSPAERQAVLILYQALLAGKAVIEKGERRSAVIEKVMADLIATEPLVQLDYAAICDPNTFEEVDETLGVTLPDILLAVAAHVSTTRLIDNILWNSGGYWLL